MRKVLRLFRRPRVFIPAGIALVVLVVLGFMFLGGEEETFQTVEATRGKVTEEVAVVGTIKSTERLDLGFLGGGKVAYVFGEEGDEVERGDTLVSLVTSEEEAQLASAQASLEREEVRLAELLGEISSVEQSLSEASRDSAVVAEESAARSLADEAREAYASVDSALSAYVDQFFLEPRSGNAKFETYINVSGTVYRIAAPLGDRSRIQAGHDKAVGYLETWREALDGSDVAAQVAVARQATAHTQLYLGDLANALGRYRAESSGDQAVYDALRADVAAARTAVNGASAGISAADSAYRSAVSSRTVADREYALQAAPEDSADVQIQRAAVRGAAAQVALAQAQVDRGIIRSPVDGRVVKLEAEEGEIVRAGDAVVSVMADAPLEIEAYVPEADVAKVKIGNVARVALDAYPGARFEARVIFVAYAETEIEGVATYKVRFQIETQDERLKPGMTADLDVETNVREDVVKVPARAVISRDTGRVVRLAEGDVSREVPVEIGIRGVDGSVEIVSGLREGDLVVVGSTGSE